MLVVLGLLVFVAMPLAYGLSSARDGAPNPADRPGHAVARDRDNDGAACDRKAASDKVKREDREKSGAAQRSKDKQLRKACRRERQADRRSGRSGNDALPPGWARRDGVPPGWARRAEAWSNMHPGLARLFERCSADPQPRRCLRDALRGDLRPPDQPTSPLPVEPPQVEPLPVIPSPAVPSPTAS